jgi:hypothetical protein
MGRKPKDKLSIKKALSLWDWVKEIQTSKRVWSSFTDEDRAAFNTFMINKVLSMNEDYIELVNMVQSIPYDQKEKYYNIYRELIPYGAVYSKYIKGSKESFSKEIIEAIAMVYSCSESETKEYIPLLNAESIEDILRRVGKDDKVIKKLLKEI